MNISIPFINNSVARVIALGTLFSANTTPILTRIGVIVKNTIYALLWLARHVVLACCLVGGVITVFTLGYIEGHHKIGELQSTLAAEKQQSALISKQFASTRAELAVAQENLAKIKSLPIHPIAPTAPNAQPKAMPSKKLRVSAQSKPWSPWP